MAKEVKKIDNKARFKAVHVEAKKLYATKKYKKYSDAVAQAWKNI